jgi:hypothetical integral membrane protein (TIGR02206 family)
MEYRPGIALIPLSLLIHQREINDNGESVRKTRHPCYRSTGTGTSTIQSKAVPLFGPLHLAILGAIAGIGIVLCVLLRRGMVPGRLVRLTIGYGLAINELIWWAFRYSHEGWRFPLNLPLQLCDMSLWVTVLACLTLAPRIVEFSYFAGLAGAGMALLTPDLWSPWPTYPAVYFFVAHGGIVTGAAALVYGGIAPLRPGAVWRAFAMLVGWAAFVGTFDAIFGANYMYLRQKPANASLLDALGPWPVYLIAGAVVALALFWLLWIPARPMRTAERETRRQIAAKT